MIIAETNRLLISKISTDDAPFILELMNSPKWLKYNGDRNVKTIDEAKEHIKNNQVKSYKVNGFGYYKLQLKTEQLKPIGSFGLIKRDTLDFVDIGFSLLPEYEGQGYGFEGATVIMNLAKNTFNIKTLCAITLPENQASIKLIEKLGLSFQKKGKTL